MTLINPWILLIAIGLGGGLGAILRFALHHHTKTHPFPWGTTAANNLGCLLFIILYTIPTSPILHTALLAGFCGALTTFSTLILEYLTRPMTRNHRLLFVMANLLLPFFIIAFGALLFH